MGNRFLTLLTNVLYNTTLTTWRRATRRSASRCSARSTCARTTSAIEPEITAKVCKRKLRIYELPIAYYGRTYAEGKKITWRDGVQGGLGAARRPRPWVSAAGWPNELPHGLTPGAALGPEEPNPLAVIQRR